MPKRTKVFIVETYLHDEQPGNANELVVFESVNKLQKYIFRTVKSFNPHPDDNKFWERFKTQFPALPRNDDRWRIHFQHSRYVIQEGFYEN